MTLELNSEDKRKLPAELEAQREAAGPKSPHSGCVLGLQTKRLTRFQGFLLTR